MNAQQRAARAARALARLERAERKATAAEENGRHPHEAHTRYRAALREFLRATAY